MPTAHAHEEAGAVVGPLLERAPRGRGALRPRERAVVVRYLEEVTAALRAYGAS